MRVRGEAAFSDETRQGDGQHSPQVQTVVLLMQSTQLLIHNTHLNLRFGHSHSHLQSQSDIVGPAGFLV